MLIGIKQGDETVKEWETDWDLPDIKADKKPVMFELTIGEHGLKAGTYTLCIKVRNPLSGGRGSEAFGRISGLE